MRWYRKISGRYGHVYTPTTVNRVIPIAGLVLLAASLALLKFTKLHDWGFGLYGAAILAWCDYISVKLAQHKVGILASLFVAYGLFVVVLGGVGLILLAIIFGE
ncbi:hypothetical protein [Levilactobacillus humaensis]|uniref:hypothetical protein n=1 Tax=Levilactobacillus humaensis TaxID=2950375 RepID=UPI0021C4812A|nr:hypothetical protein [Levilactobacillus humaensis]